MGSHAGCGGGACIKDVLVHVFSFAGFPRLQQVIPATIRIKPDFAVGVNQIQLADRGSQDYRFLPGITST